MNEELVRKRREFFADTTQEPVKLANLPTELLERIFYCLPAKDICRDVNSVCKRLHNITNTPIFWSTYLKVSLQTTVHF